MEEFEGKTIAVENGAQGQLELNALIERGRKYTPRVYEDVSGIMDASIGRVDAHLSSVADENYTMRKMRISLRQLPGNLSEREVGIAFRKNDAAMASRIERVNKAIGAMLADGTIGRIKEITKKQPKSEMYLTRKDIKNPIEKINNFIEKI